ncbi:hypothetical protein [Palpita vitrealis nucleopolyhedrovirus]|uniref:Uncharacterized protein n=1 Tax=Palpita vitrealis nucleopolyhedrovirus TaxID=2951960 RepID=A0AAE9LNF9_9ABAC|nr:hypothetical protein [Palpita vitrealis nucleopolyhedrovirus]
MFFNKSSAEYANTLSTHMPDSESFIFIIYLIFCACSIRLQPQQLTHVIYYNGN